MKNVLIPTKLNSVAKEILEEAGFNVVQDSSTDLMELVKNNPDTQALIVRSDPVDQKVLDALPKLRLVVRAGAGYNTIDTKAARRNDVDVMNTPGANARAVAEEVIAMILADYRHIVQGDNTARQGLWEKKKMMGRELSGKTVGIIGLGNIGQELVTLLSGFGTTILGFDPVLSPKRAEELNVKMVNLKDLFSQADIVSLHVPANDDTRGMVNKELLDLMKDNAMIVNCARAEIIDEQAVRKAKEVKNIRFCNDVYAKDEAGEKSCADIADLMLPHLGASTQEANAMAARRAAKQLIDYAERGITRYVVNKSVPEGLDEQYQQLAYQIAKIAHHYWESDAAVRRIECSFYGDLHNFGKWFTAPIVAGLSKKFDSGNDPEEAESWLQKKGIGFEIREPSDEKSYGSSSMTIDLQSGKDPIHQVSVRGTLAEGRTMISRINDFDNLYFLPTGHSLVFVYKDRPGIMAEIASALGKKDINIDDIRSPRDSSGEYALAALKTNQAVPPKLVEKIQKEIGAIVAFSVTI